jgi:hypothetical protein
MTILDVCQRVALVTALEKPDIVFSSADREMEELARLANEMATRIAGDHDWQVLQKIATITGDDTAEAHGLPADYARMLRTASLWSSRWSWAFNHISDPDLWLEYQTVPYTFVNGNWIIYGNEMHILPVMGSTETVKYWYISNQVVTASGGTRKAEFTADSDTFVLGERLLELGMIWQWRANKGLPYAEDMKNYEIEFNKRTKHEAGSASVVSGRPHSGKSARGLWAFPQTVGNA